MSARILTLWDLVVNVGRVERDHGLVQGPVLVVGDTHWARVLSCLGPLMIGLAILRMLLVIDLRG